MASIWRAIHSHRAGNYWHGQRTLSSFDTKDLQHEVPVPAAGFAFHNEAHLSRMLLEQ
jgi:hypothetical protein